MSERRYIDFYNDSSRRLNWASSAGFNGEIESGQRLHLRIFKDGDIFEFTSDDQAVRFQSAVPSGSLKMTVTADYTVRWE